ncbi:MAG: CDP-diacylglycerol--serine O-phosphatidyltransferase [Cytophagales bacterium]|nr:CDP-diacylglycerol--serine O-phosphatidyltransferase [Cytophagales bacterium]
MKIFTLPNFITLGNLICGMIGLRLIGLGDLSSAAILIFVALILDFFDGFVARLTNSHSEIGKQLDSLADMVSFGVLPSFILFSLLEDQGWIAFIGFVPALFSALRLAKFNIDERQSTSFFGLPTPANAMTVASFPLIIGQNFINSQNLDLSYFFIAYSIIISFLLIADIPMMALKFKDFTWASNKVRYSFLVASLLLILILRYAAIPAILLFYTLLSIIYKPKTD